MSFYLDTSALVPLHVQEKSSPAATTWFSNSDGHKYVSDFTISEFCSVMSRLVRVNELTEIEAKKTIENLEHWNKTATITVDISSFDIREAGFLVRRPRPKLLTPDAIHLAICKRLGFTLITLDEDLIANAEYLGISVSKPA